MHMAEAHTYTDKLHIMKQKLLFCFIFFSCVLNVLAIKPHLTQHTHTPIQLDLYFVIGFHLGMGKCNENDTHTQ